MTEIEVGWGGGGGLGGLRLQACHLFQLSLFCTRGEAVKEEGGVGEGKTAQRGPSLHPFICVYSCSCHQIFKRFCLSACGGSLRDAPSPPQFGRPLFTL